ncbi:hypothetical protein TO66_17500 [Pseudomonas sp. MRSN 12121]|nr:VOC family protein [Pseudomonas sp. MRSN 12121]AJO78983.1 hypothetical protein TO66_17500 [Pseudomonas sp. MRSN 12121]
MSLHELDTFPGVTAQPDTATARFVFNHTMLRVKDITRSLDFYTRVLGFSLVEKGVWGAMEQKVHLSPTSAVQSLLPRHRLR